MVQKLVDTLAENPFINNFFRSLLMLTISKKKVKDFVAQKKDEKIFELGCGTGNYSTVFNSNYIGADLDIIHLQHAYKKYNPYNKQFIVTNGKAIGFKDKSFDKSLFIQSLHHIDEPLIQSILLELKRVTKKYIYIIDWVPFKYNLIGKYIQAHDRGKYIRPFEEQKELISSTLTIEKAFTSRSGQITSSCFLCIADD